MAAPKSRLLPILYKSLLRFAAAQTSPLPLVAPVDVLRWGSGSFDESPTPPAAALFPSLPPQFLSTLPRADSVTGPQLAGVIRSEFRRPRAPGGPHPEDVGLAALATLARLRADAACSSSVLTQHSSTVSVQVDVATTFVNVVQPAARDEFPFAYRISLRNMGSEAVQVTGRHWVITDAAGGVQTVPRQSPGVVGQAPILQPGGPAFCYVSGTGLKAASGTMEGVLHVRVVATGDTFDADAGRTALRAGGQGETK